MRRNGDFEEFSVDSSEIVIGEHVSFIAEQKKKQKNTSFASCGTERTILHLRLLRNYLIVKLWFSAVMIEWRDW